MVLEDLRYGIIGYTVYNLTANMPVDFSDINNKHNLMCLCRMIYKECSDMLLLSGKNVSIVATKKFDTCNIIISYSDTYHEKELTLKCVKTGKHELKIIKVAYMITLDQYVEHLIGVKEI